MNETAAPSRFAALVPLLVLAVMCVLALDLTHAWTADRIQSAARRHALRLVGEVMPLGYDNALFDDVLQLTVPALSDGVTPISVFRARSNGKPVGLVFMPVVARGYNGPIELVIGISYSGAITGVRVQRQRETEGLGDRVSQRHGDWIFGFDGHSLDNTARDAWGVAADGGGFDQLSGATISPRGVINAVRAVLEYYALNREALFAP